MDNVSHDLSLNKRDGGIFKSFFTRKKAKIQMKRMREEQEYINEVERAKRELQNIQRLFDNTSDPDLIDYAIYEEYAIKMKFSYLLKKAKEKNIRVLYSTETVQSR